MTKPVSIPNTFASATTAIPLSQLDGDFTAVANSINDLATYSNYVADTGAANAYVVNFPANTNTASLTAGLRVQFKAANANTGTSTLQVQVNSISIGSATIKLTDGSNLPSNAILAGALVDVMYDGTNFQLLSDSNGGQQIITDLTVSGNLSVTGTSSFTGNVTANVATVTTMAGNPTFSGNVVVQGTTTNVANLNVSGNATAAALIPSGSTVPTNGMYLPAANTLAWATNSTERMRIDSVGRMGIGGTPSNGTGQVRISKAITGATTEFGLRYDGTVSSDVTVSASAVASRVATAAASFTLTDLKHFEAIPLGFGAGSTVTNQYGFVAASNLTTATNNYGFYSNIAAATGRWNFYAAGTAQNLFSGDVLVFGAGGLGYTTGSGGAVTQATSRTTGVTLNKTNGAITLFSAAGTTTATTFTVTNSTVAATDTIIVNQKSGTNLYVAIVTAVAAGSFNITFYTTGGTATDAPVFNFAVIKAVTA